MPMAIPESESYTEEQIFSILRRINYPLKNPNVLPEPTIDNLRELQYRCVTSIPFETLSLRLTKSRGVDITAQGVFDRIVNQGRGGWCFSLNRFAHELLKGLGYTVQFTLARVCESTNRTDPIVAGALTHRLSVVRFADETKYIFDIGFGNTHFYPIELCDGAEIEFFGHRRRIYKVLQHPDATPQILGNPAEPLWCMEEYMGLDEQGAEKWDPGYLFSEQQYYEPDCVVANFYSAYSPTSPFIDKFRAVQGTLDGKYYILLNTEFKIRSAKGTDSVEAIKTEQQRQDILKKYFGIVLTDEEWLYHDQKIVS
ncbi:N-terminal acetyltransferase [Podila epicladia]|nr:N-terminal acetyltransferase [Podila epicladia]